MNEPNKRQTAAAQLLLESSIGMWIARTIAVAVDLQLADRIGVESKSPHQLANESGADEHSIHRTLKALSTIGVFERQQDGTFRNSEQSHLLSREHPHALGALASILSSSNYETAWQSAESSLRTGTSAFDRAFGKSRWEHLAASTNENEWFSTAMEQWAQSMHVEAIRRIDLSDYNHIVDVGGGTGFLLAEALTLSPTSRGTLIEQPHLEALAGRRWTELGVAGRTEFIAWDFFQPLPIAGDLVILAHVLLDWPDSDALQILASCRDAMRPGCHLLILEQSISDASTNRFAHFLDLHLLIMSGGRLRTVEDLAKLTDQAGFDTVTTRAEEFGSSMVLCRSR